MALRRLLGVIVIVVATSGALVGPAGADDSSYGPKPGSIRVSKTVVEQGKSVHIRADGFCPNAPVTVAVTAGGSHASSLDGSNSHGVVSANVPLGTLGDNTITVRGCRAGGGRQSLSAHVRVVAHQGKAHVDDSTVKRGDRVHVWANGFCRRTRAVVHVLDDGNEYKRIEVRSGTKGRVSATVKLTRAGTTTLKITGCRAEGGRYASYATVTVRKAPARSFTATPSAYAVGIASRLPVAAYAGLGGGLLVLLAAGPLVAGRRRRAQ